MSNLATALRNDGWDVVGGHFTAATKHDAIKRAVRCMQGCRILLARFHKELADAGRGLSPEAPYQVLSIRVLPGPSFFDAGWGGIYDAETRGELKHVGRALGFVRHEVQ